MTTTSSEETTVASAEIGHLYLVSVNPRAVPGNRSRETYLAARRATNDGYWFVILPVGDLAGWPITSSALIPDAIVAAFPDRRGWWVESEYITALIEEVPVAAPVDEDPRLNEEVTRLREELTSSQQALEAFKEKVTTVGHDYANRHGWCEAYDSIMREIGLTGRVRDWAVQITTQFTYHVIVEATDDEEAEALVNDTDLRNYITVPDIFEGGMRTLETQVYGSNVEVTVVSVDRND